MSKAKEKSPAGKHARTVYDALNAFFTRHERRAFIAIVVASFAIALLLFDTKLSTGGDDAAYVLQARELVSKGTLPLGFRVPGYPMVLSLFVLIDRTSVIVLKFSSVLFFVFSVASFYHIFRRRLDKLFLFAAMGLFAFNALALEYAHHTYSEMLYLLVQLWAIHFFLKSEETDKDRRRNILLAVMFGMLAFYVRAVGFTLLVAMGVVWLMKREWKTVLSAAALSGLLYLPLKIAERASGVKSLGQASVLFLANPYNPEQGNATLGGFAERMWDNLIVHAQYMIPRALGLPYSEDLAAADGRVLPSAAAIFGIVISAIVVVGVVTSYRNREQALRVGGLYVAAYLVSIFFLLHTIYASIRMMTPLVPVLVILFFVGVRAALGWFFRNSNQREESTKRWMVWAMAATLVSSSAFVAGDVERNIPVLKENLRGNEFFGYSADWVSYLSACKWVRANLPKDSVGIICRKPEMFHVYAGDYLVHGVYQVESTDPDSIVSNWRKWNMTHLMYDNFQWTATLRRYVQPVAQKYPLMFDLLHQEGEAAPTFIYRLNFAAAGPK